METFFEGLLKTSVISSAVILLIALVSPFMKKRHTVFWRYILWIVLGIRLALPLDLSVPNAVPLPFTSIQRQNIQDRQEHMDHPKTESAQKDILNDNQDILNDNQNILNDDQDILNDDQEISTNNIKKADGDDSGKQAPGEVIYHTPQTGTDHPSAALLSEKKMERDMIYQAAFCLWAVVAVFLILIQGFSYWIFRMKLKKTKTYLWTRENLPVFSSQIVGSPMLVGICRPQIILPKQHITQEQAAFIISHESAHYKRKDLAVKLLLAWCRTLHWFNPLVYYMERRAGKDMELLCDSHVVRHFSKEEKKQYGQMLLAYASGHKEGGFLCTTHFSEKSHTLKERFSNLFSSTGKKRGILFAIAGAATVLSASLFLAFGFPEDQTQSVSQGKNEKQQDILSDKSQIENSIKYSSADDPAQTDQELIMPRLSIEELADMPYGAVLPRLVYASSQRAILYDHWGMLIYDVEAEKIQQLLDLPALDLAHIQDETETTIEVSEDGNQILLYNTPDTKERFLYDIDKNQLSYTQQEHLEHAYNDAASGKHPYAAYGDALWEEQSYAVLNTAAGINPAENENTIQDTTAIAYLSLDSLQTKNGKAFHNKDIQGLSLVIKNSYLGEVEIYPLFKEYYTMQGKTVFARCKYKDVERQVVSEEYLYEDEEGWKYYLEEDNEKESRIHSFASVLDPVLLVRRKDGKRQILEDLMISEMVSQIPVLFVNGRIIYKAAPDATVIGVKDPVLVSIALDGSDRNTADDMLYHDFDNLCQDQGWVYYTGWTNGDEFPHPLCRISADLRSGPQFVQNIPGSLAGVEDGMVYYLADSSKKPGLYRYDLKTGKEKLLDKWGAAADEFSYFNSREIRFLKEGTNEAVSGSHLIFSYYGQEEMYTTTVEFPSK